MQREHADFMIPATIADHFASAGEEMKSWAFHCSMTLGPR